MVREAARGRDKLLDRVEWLVAATENLRFEGRTISSARVSKIPIKLLVLFYYTFLKGRCGGVAYSIRVRER